MAISLILLAAGAASAQTADPPIANPPIERVVVTGLHTQIKTYVQAYATRALSGTGTITRWHIGVCPSVTGFARAEDNNFVTTRIRDMAARAGAPVANIPCRANIHVYFTAQPQALLDNIRAHGGARLLTPTPSRTSSIAPFRYPIQAWYATATREDFSGTLSFDNNDENGWSGCVCDIGPPPSGPGARQHDGDHLRPGAHSEMAHVTIIADVNATRGFPFSAVADYAAMLALSEIRPAAACQPLASVTNLIFAGCDAVLKPAEASEADLAYLNGLYRIDPGESLRNQQDDIAAIMENALAEGGR